jgi:hypothetical protein
LKVAEFGDKPPYSYVQVKGNILFFTDEEQLINLSSDTSLKLKFLTMSLPEFWIGL